MLLLEMSAVIVFCFPTFGSIFNIPTIMTLTLRKDLNK